jgi:hypothetical protein
VSGQAPPGGFIADAIQPLPGPISRPRALGYGAPTQTPVGSGPLLQALLVNPSVTACSDRPAAALDFFRMLAMFHSSIVPIALPISVITGLIFYGIAHSLGLNTIDIVTSTKICTAIVNLAVGIPKNVIFGDVLSLIFVRPISLIAALMIIQHII